MEQDVGDHASLGIEELAVALLERIRVGGDSKRRATVRFRQLAFGSQDSSRVAQLCIARASGGDALAPARALRGRVREATRSMFANFVVQKIIEVMPAAATSFIPEELLGHAVDLACHPFGCRVFCRLLEHGPLEDTATGRLVDEVLAHSATLCQDPRWVAGAVCADLVDIARCQHGSRVVETALQFCQDDDQLAIAAALLAKPRKLLELAEDVYGRHVVKALLRTPNRGRAEAAKALRPAMGKLRASANGRPVLEALRAALGAGLGEGSVESRREKE